MSQSFFLFLEAIGIFSILLDLLIDGHCAGLLIYHLMQIPFVEEISTQREHKEMTKDTMITMLHYIRLKRPQSLHRIGQVEEIA